MQGEILIQLKYIFYMAFRQLRWLLGDRSPFVATLKLTYRCNLTCIHCPWSQRTSDELSTDEWKARIDELRSKGVENFIFEGGEPTLRDDLAELIDYTRGLGGKVVLSTNGTLDLGIGRRTAGNS